MALSQKAFASIFTFTRASAARDYGATGLLQTFGTDAIRQGYDPATLAPHGWLLEGSSTNLLFNSEDFSAASWTKDASSIVANAAVAPDGTTTADALIEDGTTAQHDVVQSQAKAASALPYVFSIFVKDKSGNRNLGLRISDFAAHYVTYVVNPATGAVVVAPTIAGGTFTGAAGSVTAVPGGYRVTLSVTVSTSTLIGAWAILYSGTSASYAGDGASGVYLWGAQLEQETAPSSYISTTATTATRAADNLAVSGSAFTSLFGSGAPQGTVILDLTPDAVGTLSNRTALSIDDGTSNNRLTLLNPLGTANLGLAVWSGGSYLGGATVASAFAALTKIRIGMKWASGTVSICANGGALATYTGAIPSGLTSQRIGALAAGASASNGVYALNRAYGYALADADFQAAATLGA